MKKVLLALLVLVLALGVLGAAGYAGYRYGFSQGIQSVSDGDTPFFMHRFGFGEMRRPMHELGFQRGFNRDGVGLFGRGFGFGFFSPLLFLGIWAIYMLVARSGRRLTRVTRTTEPQSKTVETEVTELKE